MQPSRRLCFYALLLATVCATLSPPAHADNLTIATDPSGATVEIDGLLSGTTPAHAELPGGYFHKTHTAFAARLEHPVVARISKQGYATSQRSAEAAASARPFPRGAIALSSLFTSSRSLMPKVETGAVTISSDSPGCEIYIDGKFVGQTPSTYPLDTGTHRIEVRAPGKETWERTLEVLRNSQISLQAEFSEQH
jgi:hypothetical protein